MKKFYCHFVVNNISWVILTQTFHIIFNNYKHFLIVSRDYCQITTNCRQKLYSIYSYTRMIFD